MLSFDARRVQERFDPMERWWIHSWIFTSRSVKCWSWGSEPMEEEEVGRSSERAMIHLGDRSCCARKPDATAEERPLREGDVNTLAGMGCSAHPGRFRVFSSAWNFPLEELKLALVTNKAGVLIDAVLEQAGTLPVFSDRPQAFRGRVPTPKPAPDMLLLAVSRMGLDPADCMMLVGIRGTTLRLRRMPVCSVMLMETGYNEGEPIAKWGRRTVFVDILKSMDLAAKEFFLLTALTFSIQPNIFDPTMQTTCHIDDFSSVQCPGSQLTSSLA